MTRSCALLLACCVALGACGKEDAGDAAPTREAAPTKESAPAKEQAAAPDAEQAFRVSTRRLIHPTLPEHELTLAGRRDAVGETLAVERIEVRAATQGPPAQVIDDVQAEVPLRENAVPLEVLDMNFDGYADFRLVQFRAAGPNIPYLNWLYDPKSQRFVRSPELDEIPSARYDPGKREIRSEWRDGPNRYGTHVYVYVAGKPILVRKEERAYQAPGVYTLTRSELVDGTWKAVEVRDVREKP